MGDAATQWTYWLFGLLYDLAKGVVPGFVACCIVFTAVLLPAAKYNARTISIKNLTIIIGKIVAKVLAAYAAGVIVLQVFRYSIPEAWTGIITLSAIVFVGWQISTDLFHRGIPKERRVGLRIMIQSIVLSWILVGIGYGISLVIP